MLEQTPTRCAIGIDVGGTKCAAALVSLPDGRLLEHLVQPTRPERGGEAVLADVIELARSMQDAAKRVLPHSIGLAVCELVGVDGQILSDATIRWLGMPIGAEVHEATKLPVIVDADVRAAARAEAILGAGQAFGSFLYISVGTGISASFVMNKRPYAGARGLTGTFASSRGLIPGEDDSLVSGPPLEQFASGPALAARFARVRPEFAGAAPEVLAMADSGDQEARRVVVTAGEALGAAIGQLINVLDPAAVVIGGGLGIAEGLYRKSVQHGLRSSVWSDVHRDVPLITARLGTDAGVIGAALAAAHREVGT
ncbi:MAG: ROK family protein [Planctomycetes bacterium]|nr:ROK family protein [Planctomycetota bacterium]